MYMGNGDSRSVGHTFIYSIESFSIIDTYIGIMSTRNINPFSQSHKVVKIIICIFLGAEGLV